MISISVYNFNSDLHFIEQEIENIAQTHVLTSESFPMYEHKCEQGLRCFLQQNIVQFLNVSALRRIFNARITSVWMSVHGNVDEPVIYQYGGVTVSDHADYTTIKSDKSKSLSIDDLYDLRRVLTKIIEEKEQ